MIRFWRWSNKSNTADETYDKGVWTNKLILIFEWNRRLLFQWPSQSKGAKAESLAGSYWWAHHSISFSCCLRHDSQWEFSEQCLTKANYVLNHLWFYTSNEDNLFSSLGSVRAVRGVNALVVSLCCANILCCVWWKSSTGGELILCEYIMLCLMKIINYHFWKVSIRVELDWTKAVTEQSTKVTPNSKHGHDSHQNHEVSFSISMCFDPM